MKRFDLFIGCFGNGTVYANKAIEENGDYKKLCHVSECGKITWYVRPDSIPGKVLLIIERDADVCYQKWNNFIDSMSEIKAYVYLLEKVPNEAFMEVLNMKNSELWEKIHFLKMAYVNK